MGEMKKQEGKTNQNEGYIKKLYRNLLLCTLIEKGKLKYNYKGYILHGEVFLLLKVMVIIKQNLKFQGPDMGNLLKGCQSGRLQRPQNSAISGYSS